MAVRHVEDKDSPELQAKLKSIGFEQAEFEPKVNNRFIVKVEGLPSYVIKAVDIPGFNNSQEWVGSLRLTLYNPMALKIEQAAIDLVKKTPETVTLTLLGPVGDIDTQWIFKIVPNSGEVSFYGYDWSNTGEANYVLLSFDVESATLKYEDTPNA